ncbi:MAG TPA: hypothetical protein VE110_09590 [Gemmatimonadaceae bacterium]|nr:hypothetical protein [Gemmatimonadaceae bacterium]
MRSVLSVLLLVAVVGCSSDTLEPKQLDGVWVQDFFAPGSSLSLNLVSSGSTISGDGNWCGEALGCGTVAVTGTVNGKDIHLDLALTEQTPQVGPTALEHFDGTLTLVNTLDGALSSDPSGVFSQHVVFRRPPTDPV